MRYPETFKKEQVEKCLARLEIKEPLPKDLDGLNRLLFAQLTHIPFDSLDVWGAGCCPSLQLQEIYEKIVEKGRGGYCFELNTLFRHLLHYLGFEVYQAVSSLVNEDGTPHTAAHNVIICTLNGEKYLIDVGFGGPVPFGAVPLKEGSWENFKLRVQDGFWYLDRWEQDHYRPSIRFRDVPATMEELIPLNYYISQKPDSHFRHRLNVSVKQPDGSIHRLCGNQLHIRTAEGAMDRTVSNQELSEVLLTHFGIPYFEIPEEKPLCGEF